MSTAFDFTGHIEPETESNTPKFQNFFDILKRAQHQEKYNNKMKSKTKNFKRYRQFQPRSRGTNHTLMRKGNNW
jgi:hypothetical protein